MIPHQAFQRLFQGEDLNNMLIILTVASTKTSVLNSLLYSLFSLNGKAFAVQTLI